MKKTMLIFVLALGLSAPLRADQSDPKKPYPTGMLNLGLAYQAKELCSCLWVTGRSEKECRKDVYFPQLKLASLRVDGKHKRVKASLAFVFGAKAHFVSPRYGCVLD